MTDEDPYAWMNGKVLVRLEVENYKGNRQRVALQEVISDEVLRKAGLDAIALELVRRICADLEKF